MVLVRVQSQFYGQCFWDNVSVIELWYGPCRVVSGFFIGILFIDRKGGLS